MIENNNSTIDINQSMIEKQCFQSLIDQSIIDINQSLIENNQSIIDFNQSMIENNQSIIDSIIND